MKKKNFKYLSLVLSLSSLMGVQMVLPSKALAQEVNQTPPLQSQLSQGQTEGKVPGVALLLEGKTLCLLSSKEDYDRLLTKIKENYLNTKVGNVVEEFSIEPKISMGPISEDDKETKELISVDQALDILLKGDRKESFYLTEKDETFASIGEKYGLGSQEIMALNPGKKDPLKKGSQIKVLEENPLIHVISREIATWKEEIPFETLVKEDPTLFQGQSLIYVQGEKGQKELTSHVYKVDGQVESSYFSRVEIINEPVNQVVLEGGLERPKGPAFINPSQGRLTSRFGPRWGRFHYGIDIANPIGTEIVASCRGRVSRAGWAGTYGNLVEIDHQNGYVTRYAHLSQVGVSIGQEVEQGQFIGKMGSTGRSTGSHLHFEVRENGKAMDPLLYVRY